jgi:hypothetical protein
MLNSMGINIRGIVSQNQGDLRGTVVEFAKALDKLEPMKRAQAIEQLFGKFQFARISALFDNVIKEGSQASRVLDLAGSSLSELAALSDKELGVSAASAMNKFRAAVEQLKVALAPLGELFLEIATPFIDFATKVLDAFNNLPDGIKRILGTVITVIGGLGPVLLMTFGLINNGIANMIKFFATVRLGYLKMTGQAKGIGDETQYMTQEQLEAAAAAASLDQAHAGLTQRFTAEKTAVDALRDAYSQAAVAGARFAAINPGMMKPGTQAAKYAKGGVVTVGGRGNKDTEPALLTPGEAVIPAAMVKKYQPLIEGMIAGNIPGYAKGVMLGMPKSAKSVSKGREASEEIYEMFLKSSYANTAPTEYGHQISPTSGHSFPIFGLGGVYQKGNKQVFVKPVLDEKAALAEMRSTEITRKAHGLQAPEQKIVVIRDPMDTTRQRRFLALESDLDPKFVNNQPMGLFNEDQYFKQLVASLLRVDKDLSGSNVFGNVVADAGPAGVFSRASGLRNYEKNLPSMEDQALVNLLGIKGGAKRAFAESTLSLMSGLTPEQYKQRMLGEIQKVLPRLKETIASFRLTNPTEVGVYDDMVRRLETGLGVDWAKFHSVHSAVKIPKPKVPKQSPAVPGYKDGVVSVPGPRGAGDVTPAMLAPGEAVIPAAMAKKYAPLIQGMIAGNIPGYAKGTGGVASFGNEPVNIASKSSARALEEYYKYLIQLKNTTEAVDKMFAELLINAEKNSDGLVILTKAQAKQAAEANKEINTKKSQGERKVVLGHLQGVKRVDEKTGERTMGSLTRRVFQDQNVMFSKTGQPIEEFSKDWKAVTGGLNESVELGGVELTESVKKTAQLIDDQIHDSAIKLANGGKITDEILESATNQVLDTAEKASGEMARVSAALKKVRDNLEFEVNAAPTAGTRRAAGLQKPNESEQQAMNRMVAEKNATLEGRNFKLTPQGMAAGISSTAEIGRLSSNDKFRSRQRVAQIPGSRTYLDNQSKDPSRKDVSVDPAIANRVVKNIKDEVGESLLKASASASPSEKTIKATNNMVDGVTQTLVNSKDDVAKATETMLSPVTGKRTGPRRASTDPAVMAAIAGNQAVVQASREPRRVSRPADNTAPNQAELNLAKINSATQAQLQGLQKMSMSVSAVSFGLSSLTGVLSSFGADLNGIMPVISGVTGALFALSMATSTLTQAKFAETIATKVNIASGGAGFLTGIKNILTGFKAGAKGLTGISNVIKGVAGAFGRMFPILSKLIGPLAIATTLFAGWQIYNNIQEEARRKLRGLSDAANMSSEKIKALGLAAGEQSVLEKASFKTEDTTGTSPIAGSDKTEAKTFIESLGGTEEFNNQYKNEIAAIKEAKGEQTRLLALYQSLAIQFNALGMSEGAIEKVINALKLAAGEKDVVLDFKSLTIVGDEGTIDTAAIERRATNSVAAYQAAYEREFAAFVEKAKIAAKNSNTEMPSMEELQVGFNTTTETALKSQSNAVQKETIAATTSELQSLRAAFEAGTISLIDYQAATSASIAPLALMGDESQNLTALLTSMEVDPTFISSLTDLSDKAIVLQAALAGVDLTGFQEGIKSKDIKVKSKALKDLAIATREATIAQEKNNVTNSYDEAVSPIEDEIRALEEQIAVKEDVAAVTGDTALAQQIAGDASLRAAFLAAQAADVLAVANGGQATAVNQLIEDVKKLNSLKDQLASSSTPSGGGQKSAFQEAIDSLKEQQKEAKSSIMAYAKLRSAGFGVAEASTIAKDSMLAAALASEKVGSRKWNQLVTAIREARAEEEAWLNTTPEGRAEQFAGVYGKVMDVFNAQQAILEMNNETATASTRKIIEALEKQIEVYQRRSAELERDLEKISEKENEINKAYDEKTKALETVKKLNQDIINQQKSQLSIADALSRGDISAAASAMQDARAQSAASQGDAMGTALDASRNAQLDALTQNGKTRAQIEAEIKQIKEDISTIEFGALQNARDFVDAADQALETAIENLRVQGLSKTEWENINTRIEASKANAALYEAEVLKALENAKGLVGEWEKLEETFTTTHVVNTIYTSSGGGPGGPGPDPEPDPEPQAKTDAERVRDALNDPKYASKVSAELRKASGANSGSADSQSAKVQNYISKITKAQADAILKAAGVIKTGPAYVAKGGYIKPMQMAVGGFAQFAKGTDTVPAMLTPGEFVVNSASTKRFAPLLEAINSENFRYSIPSGPTVPNNFSNPVYNMPERNYSDIGDSAGIYQGSSGSSSLTAQDNSVYNNSYSLSVNVGGTDVSANEIANVVMNKIRTIESQQVRRQVLR